MKEKLSNLIKELNKGLIEREDTIKIALLTMLAQENIILIGPPGTAKSEISRRMAQAVKGDEYFEYLLTKFTTPEEIFGPLSIKELKEDKFKRNTDGYLPSAKIAFLDEIFKANSSILNSLLTIINEKKYHNGKEKMDVPLLSMVGASNELPVNDEELRALYDRFLVRKVVDYISDEKISELMDISGEECKVSDHNKLTSDEMKKIGEESKNVTIPEGIKSTIEEIRRKYKEEFKENSIEDISDRRLIKIVKLLKVSAHTNGRKEVDESDLILLRNCLWNDIDSRDKTGKIVTDIVRKNTKINIAEKINSKKTETVKKERKNGKMAGDGSKDNPFIIENALDLYSLTTEEYGKKGYYFEQIQDIDLKGIDWVSIDFYGYYNGNNFKIKNLGIRVYRQQNGLFKKIYKDSDVKNLNIENYKMYNYEGGGIAEENEGSISNMTISGEIEPTSRSGILGGVIGKNKGKIYQVHIIQSIIFTDRSFNDSKGYINLGGIAGENNGDISRCSSRLNLKIEVKNDYEKYISGIGGISGKNFGNIENCNSEIIQNKDKLYLFSRGGGIASENSGTINNCLAEGKELRIEYQKYYNKIEFGGISGMCDRGEIKNSISLIYENQIRISLETREAKLSNNYSIYSDSDDANCREGKKISYEMLNKTFYERMLKWDFETIWNWDSKANKPVLRKIGETVPKVKENKSENKILVDPEKIFKDNIWL